MQKIILFLFAFSIISFSQAQPLTGIKTIQTGGDYATLESAIADLNSQGVGPGGVTFNIAAGHTETFSSPTAGLITATGTSSNPIIFQRSGIGPNPMIHACEGTSFTQDAIIKIAGGDYITVCCVIFDVGDGDNTTIEWGFALVKRQNIAPFDGCQHVTIKDCVIALNKNNPASVGIYSGNHTATSTTPLTITAASDAMNNCKFYNNTISNSYAGIQLNGYAAPAPYTLYDANNEIGVEGANTITNFGGGASTSYGISSIYQKDLKVANNIISGGTGTSSSLYGIFTANGTIVDIYSNTVTITGGGTSSALYGIRNTSGVSTYTCNIYNNTITNCSFPTATSGNFYGISNEGTPTTLNLYSNSVNNNTLPGTGNFFGIFGGSPANLNMYDNTVNNNSKTGSGTLYCMRAGTSVISLHDNIVHSNSISTTGTVTAPGIIYGYYNTGPLGLTIYNNQIYDLSVSGTTSSTSTTICGIYSDGDDPLAWLNHIWNLTVTTAGSGTIYGIYTASGGTINIDRNNIHDISACGPSGFVIGIYLPGGTTANITNNMVGDLHKPAANGAIPLAGIRIDGGTSVNAYYNTVYLNSTSTGALFGSAALYASTTPTVTLRNNILMNTSAPTGSGITAAYRRSNTTLTSYGSASNNNCFYAGTPSATNVIFYDGTSSYQTLPNFQALVAPRDNVSITELPPFQSTISPMNLHISTTTPTWLESGGSLITGFDNDYDNDIRQGSPGYSGTGTAPDIGADEFEGQSAVCPPPINLGARNITTTSADLIWTSNSGLSDVEFGVTGFTPTGIPTNIDVISPLTISDLDTVTSYDFYVRDKCLGIYSNWVGPFTYKTYLLYTGPYITNYGGGPGGSDLSELQTLLGMGTPGFNFNPSISPGSYYYVADDITLTDACDFSTLSFYGWQTDTASTSEFTGLYVQVWSGIPSDPNSIVVYGDLETNRLINAERTGCLRTTDDEPMPPPPDWAGPVWQLTANMTGCLLPPGTYWVQVGASGISPAQCYIVPITITGQIPVGNAIQATPSGWAPMMDVGINTNQGLSLVADGSLVPNYCPQPFALGASNITGYSATLSWTPGGTETSWNIEWGPTGFTQGTGTLIEGITTNPYILTGITLCMSYDFYVQADCGLGAYSTWAGPQTFMTSLSGNYTINSAEPTGGTNFNSFTDFANAYNLCGLSGPTTVNVIGNQKTVYTEQMILTEPPTEYQLIILGGGNTLQYLATDPNEPATLRLDGVDEVTIKDLTVKALGEDSDGYGWAVWLSNGADNNTFNNCQFITTMDSPDPDFIPFAVTNYATNPLMLDQAASNLEVSNCITEGGYYGMIIKGTSNEITNNQVKDFYSYGLCVGGFGNSLITENIISRPNRAEVYTTYMIWLKGNFSGTSVTKNRLIEFAANASTTSPSYGIYGDQVHANQGSQLVIANNVICGFQNVNGVQQGIYMNGTIVGLPVYVKIYHNSISLDYTNHPGTNAIYGLYITGHYEYLDVSNNIISCSTNSTGTKYCLYFTSNHVLNSTITCDYNVLRRSSSIGTENKTGFWINTPFETLGEWQTANGGIFDQHSSFANPMFVDSPLGNLLPQNSTINDMGEDLTLFVPDDILGTGRPLGAAPDPGAYEFELPDLWSKDTPEDVGHEPNPNGPPWISEDIWVRNERDAIRIHQNPEYTEGIPNYVYVEIRNRGSQPYSGGSQVKLYWAKASTALGWEDPWNGGVWYPDPEGVLMGGIVGTQNIPTIAPDDSHYMEFAWDPPNPTDYNEFFGADQHHFCLLARIVTPSLPDEGMAYPEMPYLLGENVLNNNNIVWKNITVVDEDKKKSGFLVGNYSPSPGIKKLVFTVPDDEISNSIFDIGTVKLKLQTTLYQIWETGGKQGSNLVESSVDSSIQILNNGAFISNLAIGVDSIYGVSAEFERDLNPPLPLNEYYHLNVQQKHELSDTIDGGVSFVMNRGFLDPNRYVDLTVILEGPFNGSSMNTTLNSQGLIPLNQPYNVAPWNYSGTETVMSIPANTVDWVLIELRDAPSAAEATSATIIARQAAFLRSDGKVTDLAGNPELNFGPLTITNDLYVVIYHRNHLSVLSATRLTKSDGVYTRDFTIDSEQAYGGDLAQKEIAPGVWGMIGGDGDANGTIGTSDKDPVWESETPNKGYLRSDYNLDSQSNNPDKDDIWLPNLGEKCQAPAGPCGSLLYDLRDGKSYQTVLIGNQCWMAENLNVGTMINGSSNQANNPFIEKYCFNNNTSNCNTYGGLYQWSEAMQYALTPGVKGICPPDVGWHLPSDEEWCTLEQYIDPSITCTSTDWRGVNGGGKLKETGTTHWKSPNFGATDEFGFTALPGGKRDNGIFDYFPDFAFFWSSTEYNNNWGWNRTLYYNYATIRRAGDSKTRGYSVRCVRDWSCGEVLIDERDSQTYYTVQIGNQCWMAENLNIGTMINGSTNQIENSTIEKYCYGNNTANCDVYGGLYQWNEAMQYNSNPGVPGICPTGWHLPTDQEWCTLEQFIEPIIPCNREYFSGTHAGGDLKETGTLHWQSPNLGATNVTGFTALPGGYRTEGGSFSYFPSYAFFWSSNEYDANWSWNRALYYNYASIRRAGDAKTRGYNVRCLKDQ
jgi:uncharacterized protein (TIGR02145 family)